MFNTVTTIVGLVGVAASLLALGFTVWQLKRERTRSEAARQASEDMRSVLERERALAQVSRLSVRVEHLKYLHRHDQWGEALGFYPEIRAGLVSILHRYIPLSERQRKGANVGIQNLLKMERTNERRTEIPPAILSGVNQALDDIVLLLLQLESQSPVTVYAKDDQSLMYEDYTEFDRPYIVESFQGTPETVEHAGGMRMYQISDDPKEG